MVTLVCILPSLHKTMNSRPCKFFFENMQKLSLACRLHRNRRDRQRSAAGPADKYREGQLHKALTHAVVTTQYPRTCIQVVLQVCRAGGSELAVMTNAAFAALLDAGIAMHAMHACAAVAVAQAGQLLVDPDTREAEVRCHPDMWLSRLVQEGTLDRHGTDT